MRKLTKNMSTNDTKRKIQLTKTDIGRLTSSHARSGYEKLSFKSNILIADRKHHSYSQEKPPLQSRLLH